MLRWTWPHWLKECVQRFGEDEVYRIGEKALGYPPIWISTTEEAERVWKAVEEAI